MGLRVLGYLRIPPWGKERRRDATTLRRLQLGSQLKCSDRLASLFRLCQHEPRIVSYIQSVRCYFILFVRPLEAWGRGLLSKEHPLRLLGARVSCSSLSSQLFEFGIVTDECCSKEPISEGFDYLSTCCLLYIGWQDPIVCYIY